MEKGKFTLSISRKKSYAITMKYKLWVILAVFTAIALSGCNSGSGSGSSAGEINFGRDASYALGLNIGAGLKEGLSEDDIYPNVDQFIRGMRDGLTGKKSRFDLDQAREIIDLALDTIMEERSREARQNEIVFLAENSKNPGVIMTQSGLQYEILVEGFGPKPAENDTVVIHYDGKFTDGRFFDSSLSRGIPAEIGLDWVVPGWAEGLQLMSIGSKYRLYVPSELGYGTEGIQGIIPPYSTLIFEVELLEIKPYEGD